MHMYETFQWDNPSHALKIDKILEKFEERFFYINNIGGKDQALVPVTLNDAASVTFQIDTGSSANILPLEDYIRATNDCQCTNIVPKDITLVMHDHSKRKAFGFARLRQAYYYNLKGKALPELQPGQIVRMKKPNEKTWTEAVCKKMIGPRSYTVVSGNRTYRRNRRQLRLVPTTD
ncbi:unnamed protein product, partial [Porites lobata]